MRPIDSDLWFLTTEQSRTGRDLGSIIDPQLVTIRAAIQVQWKQEEALVREGSGFVGVVVGSDCNVRDYYQPPQPPASST